MHIKIICMVVRVLYIFLEHGQFDVNLHRSIVIITTEVCCELILSPSILVAESRQGLRQ